MVQNPYYNQPNYYMPQYQNLQAQQRQEQFDQIYSRPYSYNFVRDINEAKNWPTAPGNHLVFEDQNGMYFYTKSLGFGPNEKPIFVTYKREDFVEQSESNTQTVEQNPLKDQLEKYQSSTKLELDSLKSGIEELKELINQKPHFNNNRKGGKN